MKKIEERLNDLERLDKAATPGPWVAVGYDSDICGPYNRIHEATGCSSVEVYASREIKVVEDEENAILIATYRNETPKLIRALREAVAAMQSYQKPLPLDIKPDLTVADALKIWAASVQHCSETLTNIEKILNGGK